MSKFRSSIVRRLMLFGEGIAWHSYVSFALFLSKLLINNLNWKEICSPHDGNSRVFVLPGLSNPGVRRVIRSSHGARAACQRVQVINVVSVSRYNGVITFGYEHKLTVTHGQCCVDPAVGRVNFLNGIAIRMAYFVVVNLLQIDFIRRVVDVVFVRRIAGPVAAWSVDLDYEQSLSGKLRRQDMVDLPGGISSSTDFNRHVIRSNQTRRISKLGTTETERQIAIGECAHGKTGLNWQVERVRQTIEHVCTIAKIGPRSGR